MTISVEDFREQARRWLAESMPPVGDGWNDRSDGRREPAADRVRETP